MTTNKLIELKYQNNPNLTTLFNVNNIIFLAMFALGIAGSIYNNNNYNLGYFTFIIFIPIAIITVMYLPVFESLSTFNSLELYQDKLVIDTKSYTLQEIECSIKKVYRGHRLISANWTSCIFKNKEGKVIGEFFFNIGLKEKIFSATPEGLKKIIDDIKENKQYDYINFMHKSYYDFLNEKKGYDIGIYLLIGIFVLPAVIGILIIY